MHRTFLKTGDRWSTFWKSNLQTNCYYLFFSSKFMILRMRCCFLMVGVIGGLPQIAHLQLVYKSIWQWIKSLTVWSVVSSQDSTLRQKEDHKLQLKKKRSPKKIRHCGYLELKYISDAHIVRSTVFSIVCEKCPCYQKSVLWIVGEIGAWN